MTKEEYQRLADEWDACERVVNDPVNRHEAVDARGRQHQIEHLMEGADWQFDEDGNVVSAVQTEARND
jgi:hypothetical protein